MPKKIPPIKAMKHSWYWKGVHSSPPARTSHCRTNANARTRLRGTLDNTSALNHVSASASRPLFSSIESCRACLHAKSLAWQRRLIALNGVFIAAFFFFSSWSATIAAETPAMTCIVHRRSGTSKGVASNLLNKSACIVSKKEVTLHASIPKHQK